MVSVEGRAGLKGRGLIRGKSGRSGSAGGRSRRKARKEREREREKEREKSRRHGESTFALNSARIGIISFVTSSR